MDYVQQFYDRIPQMTKGQEEWNNKPEYQQQLEIESFERFRRIMNYDISPWGLI